MGPPRSMNFGKIGFWLHIWEFYVVTVVKEKNQNYYWWGPWWTQRKVILIQKGLLDNQNPGFCMGWPGLYLLDNTNQLGSLCISQAIPTYPYLSQPIPTYPNLFQPIQTYSNLSKFIWTYQNLSRPIWTYLNLSEPIRTYLNPSKPIWTYPNQSQPIPTNPNLSNLSEPVHTYPNLSEPITYSNLFKSSLTYPNLSKPIWTYPNISKFIWTYPNQYQPFQIYPNPSKPTWTSIRTTIIRIFSKNKRLLDFRQVSRVDELTDSLMSGITSCLSWLAATIRFARQQQNATRFLLSNCFPATSHIGLQGATLFIKLYCLFFLQEIPELMLISHLLLYKSETHNLWVKR